MNLYIVALELIFCLSFGLNFCLTCVSVYVFVGVCIFLAVAS